MRPGSFKGFNKFQSFRSPQSFSSVNLLKINKNWLAGRYVEKVTLNHKPLYLCQIKLNRNSLFKSYKDEIRAYKRESDGYLNEKPYLTVNCKQSADITHFVEHDDKIFSGLSNGVCLLYDIEDKHLTHERVYVNCELITCVDFLHDIYVTCGKTKAKVLRMETELGVSALEQIHEIPIVFQTCRLHRNRLAAGKYSDRRKRALCLVDVETGVVDEMESSTGAIYDLLWKDEHCLLTANFDSTLRITDTRTKRDELIFRDIYDSSIYCIDFDGKYGVS